MNRFFKMSEWLKCHCYNPLRIFIKRHRDLRLRLIPLSPIKGAKNIESYTRALWAALGNDDVYNIAVTGKYGAGKSSFLQTFFGYKRWRWFHRKPLWVSVAAFKSLDDKSPSKEDLELWILEQILFVEKDSLMPFSRFGRICISGWGRFCLVYVVWVSAISSLCLFVQPRFLIGRLAESGLWYSAWSCWARCISLVGGLAASVIFCYWLYQMFRKGCVSISLKLGAAHIDAKEQGGESVLNRNLEELIYFFRVTRRWVVVFEDIDRVSDKGLFVRLRAINRILNASCQTMPRYRPIKFVYAIRDDIFNTADERVKFFDFLIPIFPVLGLGMVKSLFMNLLRKAPLNKDELRLCENPIKLVAPFVADRRLVHAICDEFLIMRSVLKSCQNCEGEYAHVDRMMAMAIFKSFYPEEYAKLTEHDNIIERFLKERESRIEAKKSDITKRLSEIGEINRRLSGEGLKKEKESVCRLFLVEGFLKIIPRNATCLRINLPSGSAKVVELNYFFVPEHLQDIVGHSFVFGERDLYGGGYTFGRAYKWEEVDKMVGGRTFVERKKELDELSKREIHKLSIEQEILLGQQEHVNAISMASLVQSGEITSVNDEAGAAKVDLSAMPVFRALLADGLLAEDYRTYVTIYHDGDISRSDYHYVVSVQQGDGCGYDYRISNPEKVVAALQDYDFLRRNSFNFDVLAWVLKAAYSKDSEAPDCVKERCKRLAQYMLSRPSELSPRKVSPKMWLQFLQLKSNGLSKEIFEAFNDCETELQDDLFNDKELSDAEKRELFVRLYRVVTENDGELVIEEDHWALLCKCDNVGAQLKELNAKREVFVGAMRDGIKFSNYRFDVEPYLGFDNDLIENNAYDISTETIACVLRKQGKLLDEWRTRLLTVIARSKIVSLHEYVKSSFATFIQNVYLELPRQYDEKEVLVEYLNDNAISIADKRELVRWQLDMDIPFDAITSDDVVRILWNHPKCDPPMRLVKKWFEGAPSRSALVDEFAESCKDRYQDEDLKELKESLKGSDDVSEAE